MPEKDVPNAISRIFGMGRSLRARLPKSLSRKGVPSPWQERGARVALLLVLSLLLALILSPRISEPQRKYKEGDVVRENVKAIGEFLVEDVETTGKKQQELLTLVPPVFDLQEQLGEEVQQRLQKAMDYMRRISQEAVAPPQPGQAGAAAKGQAKSAVPYKILLDHKPEFDRILGVSVPKPTFHLLAKAEFSPYIEAMISQVLAQFLRQGVISSRTILKPEPREIMVRRLPSRDEVVEHPPFAFIELDEGRKSAAGYCRDVAIEVSGADRWLVCDMTQLLLVPNVSPNWAETHERQQARLQELKPVYFKVKRGEMLVREGERITPLHLVKLQAQTQIYPRSRGVLIFLGLFVCLAVLLGVSYQLARITLRRFSNRLLDLIFVAALLLASTLMIKGLLVLGDSVSRNLPLVSHNLVYVLPLGLAAILAAMFLGLETGVGVACLSATFAALVVDNPFPLFIYFVVAGLMGVWGVKSCRRRSALIQTGLIISVANMILVAAFKLLEFPFTGKDLLIGEVFALGGGVLTGILALGLAPIMESLFSYSSNIRLLELLNLDQPVLRDLMLIAPGTYHHSMVVGQMVEAAAETIGANPMLAKAAAFYHDIGKIKKPNYFVENQTSGENKHEKLAPSMSSLILISHVKDGVDLARKHRLGEHIADIIRQHHGTNLISYFFHKAQTQAAKPNQAKMEDYRYPGPRPQTKEAGLVLLADQVEAASRTLTDPTPARIQGMVQKIINNVFADGQLDECELTLKDLHHIARSFNKILSGIFHQRIQYPQAIDKKKSHEDLDKQPPKKNGTKSGEGQEKSREDLKRLGIV
ncbi:MAG: HDIG domain-containing protein [Deltaproteobacteria bacterium]|nr:HDIG domain-containing protein [Deltaproteobacteria bacterium]